MRSKYTLLTLALAAHAFAGGRLEQINITGNVPSPRPGEIVARVVGIEWDARTLPVRYRVNNTLNPIPNPLGAAFLTVAAVTPAVQASLDQWNQIPTSFISMQVVGTTANPGLVGFDMVNEVTFRTAASFGAIASSPSVSLIADATLANGDDIDGDGDSDVSSAITTAQDVDNDGDIEFPAGFYKAGTILDNDVQFNTKPSGPSGGFRFTIADADADTVTRSVDFMCVAVHEFGHSMGLSHTLNNQNSATDGNGATMYPFIDTGDPASELSQRTIDIDDIAWASYLYPEGSAASGPGALQPGDVAFNSRFGLIQGTITSALTGGPVAGASVFALDRVTGAMSASGFSGTTRVSFNPATGQLFLIDPAFNITDGKYTVPVPKGSYFVGVEPVDGSPVPTASVSLTAQIGGLFGLLNFNEEFYRGRQESEFERRPGRGTTVPVQPGSVAANINIFTDQTLNLNNFGNRNFVGFTGSTPGSYYAVRIPINQLNNPTVGPDYLVHSALYETFVFDASVPAAFSEAMLTTGAVAPNGTATLNLTTPLRRVAPFVAQDGDFAPFFFDDAHELGKTIREGIASGSIQNLFLVLRLPTSAPFAGVSGLPPVIGLDGGTTPVPNDAPIFGLSYTSTNGVTFTPTGTFNFRFSLVLSAPAKN